MIYFAIGLTFFIIGMFISIGVAAWIWHDEDDPEEAGFAFFVGFCISFCVGIAWPLAILGAVLLGVVWLIKKSFDAWA